MYTVYYEPAAAYILLLLLSDDNIAMYTTRYKFLPIFQIWYSLPILFPRTQSNSIPTQWDLTASCVVLHQVPNPTSVSTFGCLIRYEHTHLPSLFISPYRKDQTNMTLHSVMLSYHTYPPDIKSNKI